MEKQYKSSIIKNHKIIENDFFLWYSLRLRSLFAPEIKEKSIL